MFRKINVYLRVKIYFTQFTDKTTIAMKDFQHYTFEDFERVPRVKTSEVTMAKRHRHTPIKVKSCTVNLNDGYHNSRPLSEVLQ